MSFYTILYYSGVIINIINFIYVIKSNPLVQIRLQLLNDKSKFCFYLQIFLLSFISWILVFINFVYKFYVHIERKKK